MTVGDCPIRLLQKRLTRHDLAHAVFDQLALDVHHEAIRREGVKLDAAVQQKFNSFSVAPSTMPARCAPRGDLATRRCTEPVVFEVRTEIANVAQRKATRRGSRRPANRAKRPKSHQLRRRPIKSWEYDGDARSRRAQRAVPDLWP